MLGLLCRRVSKEQADHPQQTFIAGDDRVGPAGLQLAVAQARVHAGAGRVLGDVVAGPGGPRRGGAGPGAEGAAHRGPGEQWCHLRWQAVARRQAQGLAAGVQGQYGGDGIGEVALEQSAAGLQGLGQGRLPGDHRLDALVAFELVLGGHQALGLPQQGAHQRQADGQAVGHDQPDQGDQRRQATRQPPVTVRAWQCTQGQGAAVQLQSVLGQPGKGRVLDLPSVVAETAPPDALAVGDGKQGAVGNAAVTGGQGAGQVDAGDQAQVVIGQGPDHACRRRQRVVGQLEL